MAVGKELGQRIREIRKSHNLTEEQLASRMEISQSRLSKLENGRLAPTIEFLHSLSRTLRLPSAERESLLALGELILGQFRLWDTVDRNSITKEQKAIQVLEQNAQSIHCYQDQVIPGLLQIPQYTSALFAIIDKGQAQEIESAKKARFQRRLVLSKRDKDVDFVIAEGTLRRVVGSLDVMVGQLDYLISLHDSGIQIRILPNERPTKAIPCGSFDIFDESVVVLETLVGVLTLTRSEQVARYIAVFSSLRDESSVQREGRDMLESVREHLISQIPARRGQRVSANSRGR